MSKRRANGEGMLRHRKNDNLWEYTISLGYNDDGKRKTKSFYGKTQAEVKAKAEKFLQSLVDMPEIFSKDYLFPEWADIWFADHKCNIAPSTQENYPYILRPLKQYFSRRLIKDIKAYDVEQFIQFQLKEGKAYSTVAKYRGMMFQIMNKAEANDLIRKNPVRLAEKTRKTKPVTKKESFTEEEVKLLMIHLPDNRIGWSIRLLLGSGLRTQELLALQPLNIAADGSVVYIRNAVTMVKGTPFIGPPKTENGDRDVPIPDNIRYCAVNLRNTEQKYVWEGGKKDHPCNPKTFRKYFKNALSAIPGVRILTPHCCRHTYVSMMQSLEVDIDTIRSIVGHAEISMTQHYLHVQESIRQEAIRKYAEKFGNLDSE